MNCCRLCLSNKYLEPIFHNSEENPKLSIFLYKIAGIEIKLNDGLPKEICSKCMDFVNLSAKFWNRCQFNQEILKQSVDNGSVHDNFSFILNKVDSKVYNHSIKERSVQDNYKNSSENLSNKEKNISDTESENMRKNYKISIEEVDTVNLVNQDDYEGSKGKTNTSFECNICHKTLKNKNCLKSHFKRHTGFDFVCEHCGKSFITKRVLLTHCRAKHGYERTDKCSYCEYTGCNAEQIKVHERLHTGEKPYSCRVCGAGFHRNSNYLQHIPVHLSEKTVQCDQCPLLFKSATLMRIHRDNRHKKCKYQYRCRICENNFTRRRNALTHLKRIHNVEEADKVERINL